MNKKITFHNMPHSPTLEEFSNKHMEKVERFLQHEQEPIHIELILDAERTHHHHRVEILVKSPHYDLVAHAEGPEMYDLITQVTHTMHQELLKKKERLVDEKKHGLTDRTIK
jgi:ribosomal subunit interface protein